MADVKFKDLVVDDAFNFCAVLDAIGTDQLFGAFSPEEIEAMQENGSDMKTIGIAVAMKIGSVLIKNFPKAKDPICSFFANCMEWDNGSAVTADELKKFKIGRFFKLIKEFFKKDDLVDFFKDVAELLDMGQDDSRNSATGDTATPTAT